MTTTQKSTSRPFYAAVGAGDLAVTLARTAVTEAQTRFAKVELEPKALRDQALTLVTSRVEELQADAKLLPAKAQKFMNEYVAELNISLDELNKKYAGLATRGQTFVGKVRGQESPEQAETAAPEADN